MSRSTFAALVFTLMTVLAGRDLLAQAQVSSSCDALKTYLTVHGEKPMRIAALDHVTNTWSGWAWDGKDLVPLSSPNFKVPPANDPTLVLNRGGRAGVFLINTNPLIFATKQGAVSVTDIAAIDDLKKVLSLMGAFTSSALQMSAQNITSDHLMTQVLARVTPRTVSILESVEREVDPLSDAVTTLVTHLDAQKPAIESETRDTIAAAKTLSSVANRVASARDVIAVQMQLLESEPAKFSPTALSASQVKTSELLDAFDQLASEASQADQVPATCPETIAALRQSLLWKIDGVPATQQASSDYRKEWREIIDALASATSGCDAMGAHIQTIGRWLAVNPPGTGPSSPAMSELFTPLFRAADDFSAVVTKRDAAVSKAHEALAKRTQVLQQTVQVSNFYNERDRYLLTASPADADCLLTHGIVPIREIDYDALGIGPTKIRTEEFSVTIRPAFSSGVESARGESAGKFNLKKSNFDFDLDTAVTYSRLYESTYAAVKAQESDTTFTIREKERKTRAGQLALMVTGTPASRYGLGLQVGFGLETANPSLYTGLAWRLGDFAKVSFGETFQRVTKLSGGQFVGMNTLPSAEALSTRDGWTSRPYLSLSLTLDSLPIFSGK